MIGYGGDSTEITTWGLGKLVQLRTLKQRMQRNRAIRTANVVVLVASALTTASLGSVLQDALPKPGHHREFVWYRWLFLCVALGLLVFAVWWRSWAKRATGTLFYVQLLDESMEDKRIKAVDKAAEQHLSRRTISRWLHLDGCLVNGVLDVQESCHGAGKALEDLINLDEDDTATSLAPNALWPMALALGMDVPAGAPAGSNEVKVVEIADDHEGARDEEFSLKRDEDPMDLTVRIEEVASSGTRDGLWLAFTEARRNFRLEQFRQFGVRTARRVSCDDFDPGAPEKPPRYTGEDMRRMAPALAQKIAALGKSGRELVVVAMIPKSVALAIGWHLAQIEGASLTRTHLMHFDGRKRQYFPMRVRASQPSTSPVSSSEDIAS